MPSKITTKVRLGESFNQEVENAIHEQIRIAQNKWGLALNKEHLDLIYKNTKLQLKEKLFEVYKHEQKVNKMLDPLNKESEDSYEDHTDLDLKLIRVVIKSKQERDVEINVGEGVPNTAKVLVARTSQGYIVTEEEIKDSVWLEDLPQKMKEDILAWAQTAAYYGVASFA